MTKDQASIVGSQKSPSGCTGNGEMRGLGTGVSLGSHVPWPRAAEFHLQTGRWLLLPESSKSGSRNNDCLGSGLGFLESWSWKEKGEGRRAGREVGKAGTGILSWEKAWKLSTQLCWFWLKQVPLSCVWWGTVVLWQGMKHPSLGGSPQSLDREPGSQCPWDWEIQVSWPPCSLTESEPAAGA